jgi:hypothetical protein
MAEREKPPLGVKPYYIFYSERIIDLTKALLRCTLSDPERACLYAVEISMLEMCIKTLAEQYSQITDTGEEEKV